MKPRILVNALSTNEGNGRGHSTHLAGELACDGRSLDG
jgi:hypothetical protein